MLPLLLTLAFQPAAPAPSPQELWQAWSEERYVSTPAPCLRPGELADRLRELADRYPDRLRLDEVGRSYLDRPIHLLSLGAGERKVLLWSQMHGDEPSATPALLDLADFLLGGSGGEAASEILDRLTLLMVPMLNPDGAELYERRNAQGIDVNRDALNLATPEGRLLKRLRDEHQPILGFNLHDQNRRTAVGDTGRLATNAVLAVAGDPRGHADPGPAARQAGLLGHHRALAPLMPGGMARYDEDWSPRAFGDNLTAWGTPVVLIESGGLPPGRDLSDLTRLNFVALFTVLHELARDDLAGYGPRALRPAAAQQLGRLGRRRGRRRPPAAAGRAGRLPGGPRLRRPARRPPGGRLRRPRRHAIAHRRARRRTLPRRRPAHRRRGRHPAGAVRRRRPRLLGAALARRRRPGPPRPAGGRARCAGSSSRAALAAARAHAAPLERPGRPRVEVVAAPAGEPWLRLDGPPAAPRSAALADVIAALLGDRRRREAAGLSAGELLDRLWATGGSAARLAAAVARPAGLVPAGLAGAGRTDRAGAGGPGRGPGSTASRWRRPDHEAACDPPRPGLGRRSPARSRRRAAARLALGALLLAAGWAAAAPAGEAAGARLDGAAVALPAALGGLHPGLAEPAAEGRPAGHGARPRPLREPAIGQPTGGCWPRSGTSRWAAWCSSAPSWRPSRGCSTTCRAPPGCRCWCRPTSSAACRSASSAARCRCPTPWRWAPPARRTPPASAAR